MRPLNEITETEFELFLRLHIKKLAERHLLGLPDISKFSITVQFITFDVDKPGIWHVSASKKTNAAQTVKGEILSKTIQSLETLLVGEEQNKLTLLTGPSTSPPPTIEEVEDVPLGDEIPF